MFINLVAEIEKREKKKPCKKQDFLDFLDVVKEEVENGKIDPDCFILPFTEKDGNFGVRWNIKHEDYVRLIGLLESTKILLGKMYVE